MTKRQRNRRGRLASAQEFNVQREVDYITDCAARGDARIVTLRELVFLSTSLGDAWMLDAEDGLAYCLMHNCERRQTPVRSESEQSCAVAWDSEFALESGCFSTRSADGRVTAWPAFPADDIQAAVRRVVESRRR